MITFAAWPAAVRIQDPAADAAGSDRIVARKSLVQLAFQEVVEKGPGSGVRFFAVAFAADKR